jgi:hypothetical protein
MEASEAWRMFDGWRAAGQVIGVLYVGRHGTLTTSGTVTGTRMGRLQINGETTEASFRLNEATFVYGPVQVFPRWPYPPPVEVIGVQARFPGGEWLVLAENFRPKAVQ